MTGKLAGRPNECQRGDTHSTFVHLSQRASECGIMLASCCHQMECCYCRLHTAAIVFSYIIHTHTHKYRALVSGCEWSGGNGKWPMGNALSQQCIRANEAGWLELPAARIRANKHKKLAISNGRIGALLSSSKRPFVYGRWSCLLHSICGEENYSGLGISKLRSI